MTASVELPLERSKLLGIIPLELAHDVSASPEITTPIEEGFIREPREMRISDTLASFTHDKKKALYPSISTQHKQIHGADDD
jgi:hypothetical protein